MVATRILAVTWVTNSWLAMHGWGWNKYVSRKSGVKKIPPLWSLLWQIDWCSCLGLFRWCRWRWCGSWLENNEKTRRSGRSSGTIQRGLDLLPQSSMEIMFSSRSFETIAHQQRSQHTSRHSRILVSCQPMSLLRMATPASSSVCASALTFSQVITLYFQLMKPTYSKTMLYLMKI